jgi:hypothetical protein
VAESAKWTYPPLRPYEAVIDLADVHQWRTELRRGRNGWELAVYDGKVLIAKGRSMMGPPECFRRLGSVVSLALEKSGRIEK